MDTHLSRFVSFNILFV